MTRKEAIDIIKNLPVYRMEKEYDEHSDLMTALHMAVKSLAKGWIPVTKRLPSEEGTYLATGIKGSVYTVKYIMNTVNGKSVGMWWRSGGGNAHVTAWMPLPQAYKGE